MLHVHRAARSDALVAVLAHLLARPPADPFDREAVVVHSRGIERWVAQRLSLSLGARVGDDGVCANVDFPFPSVVVRRALAAAGGPAPEEDPWAPERLVWTLLDLVDGLGDESWSAPLRARTGRHDGAGRFAVLRTAADHLDRYAVHRPRMLLRWLAGDDVDGAGAPLPDDERWQPALFRAAREAIAQPSGAERTRDAVVRLRDGAPVPGVPHRFALFGFTALPAGQLAVLRALAEHRDVHLLLLHPSASSWAAMVGIRGGTDDDGLPVLPLRAASPLPEPRSPLLRSWGRDTREMQVVVQTIAGDTATALHEEAADGGQPATLLHRLQDDVRADRDPRDVERLLLGAGDDSVRVLACHGQARQVEALRDVLLELLEADPTLQPRDILVMCPDVETFAPLVTAHLGRSGVDDDDADPLPDLRVRLADRSIRQANPVLRTVADVLALAAGRVTASALVDLVGAEPVRRRFRFRDDALERIERWVRELGVRWGLDDADRVRFGLGGVRDGTVATAVSRLALGVAMADEDHRTVGGVAPYDDVEGTEVAIAGRLAELVARLRTALARLQGPQPIDAWVDALTAAADALTAPPIGAEWQRTQLAALLDDVRAEAGGAAAELSLAEVRALLDDRLRGRPTRANHRTGDLTVCTLVPMRSIPHRVVGLLGMDDEVFPRRTTPHGDDLLAAAPAVGDRDRRTEDRQLLLDALLAAGDHLVVTYNGRDDRSGTDRPPCVPVAELLDVIDRTAVAGDGRSAAAAVTRRPPLHGYDPQAFAGDPHRGFDGVALEGARALLRRPVPRPRTAVAVPHAPLPDPVDVVDLARFLVDPATAFVRRTLGTWVPDDPEAPDEQLLLDAWGLPEWKVGQALLECADVDDDAQIERALAVLRGRGELPPAPFDAAVTDKAVETARGIVAHGRALDAFADEPRCVEVEVLLQHPAVALGAGSRRLVGAVPGVRGATLLDRSYSKVKAKRLLDAWVRLLALTAHDPATAWTAVVLGRHKERKNAVVAVRLGPLGGPAAARGRRAGDLLADLVALQDLGLREPLVLPADTSGDYARARVRFGKDADAAAHEAAQTWTTEERSLFPNDDLKPAHVLLLEGQAPFEVVLAAPPSPGDAAPAADGDEAEPHRFGALALRVWRPVLAACTELEPS